MMRVNKIHILFFIIIILSCSKDNNINNNNNVEDSFYLSYFIEIYDTTYFASAPTLLMERSTNFKAIASSGGWYEGDTKFMYSWDKKDHYFQSSDLEIIFTREMLAEEVLVKPEHCIVSVRNIKDELKAFFICWQNSKEIIKKDSNKMYKKDYSIYYDSTRKVHFYEYFSGNYFYSWDITSKTDSLWTNLDISSVEKIFPSFNGKCTKVEVDSIFVNYNYFKQTYEFFNKIHFNNYNLGYYKNYYEYYLLRDSLIDKDDFRLLRRAN